MLKIQISDFFLRFYFPASLPLIATFSTCILGGLMGQAFGRRLSLLLVAPIFAVSFILQAIAEEVAMFQFGRFLSGIAGGLLSGPASVNCTIVIRRHFSGISRPIHLCTLEPVSTKYHRHIYPIPHIYLNRPTSAKFPIQPGGLRFVPVLA